MQVLQKSKQVARKSSAYTGTTYLSIQPCEWFQFSYFTASTIFSDNLYNFLDESARDVLLRINKMQKLKTGWNGYGAIPPSEISVKNAIGFVSENAKHRIPYYFAAPGVNGEVLLEIKSDDKVAEIYFNPDHSSELLLYKNEELVLEGTIEENRIEFLSFFS